MPEEPQTDPNSSPTPTEPTEPNDDATENENETPPEGEAEPETFPRSYVEQLRTEAAGLRLRAVRSDDLARALAVAYAAETRLLADPTDLGYSEALCVDGVPDRDRVQEAVEDLIARKPHLRSRTPQGSIDQGAQGEDAGGVSLAGLLKAGAG